MEVSGQHPIPVALFPQEIFQSRLSRSGENISCVYLNEIQIIHPSTLIPDTIVNNISHPLCNLNYHLIHKIIVNFKAITLRIKVIVL